MKSIPHSRYQGPTRGGAALVEFALMLPVILIFLVGALDVGRGIMVEHKLVAAARAGCRLYAVKSDASEQDVRDIVTKSMTDAGIMSHTIAFSPDPSVDPAHLDPLTITVTVSYDQIAWTPSSWFLTGATLKGACTMPADTTGTVYYTGGKSGGTPAPPPPPPPSGSDDDDTNSDDDDSGSDDDGDSNDDDGDDDGDGDDDDD